MELILISIVLAKTVFLLQLMDCVSVANPTRLVGPRVIPVPQLLDSEALTVTMPIVTSYVS